MRLSLRASVQPAVLRVLRVLGWTFALATAALAANGAKADSSSLPSLGAFSITSKKEPIQITSEKLDFDYKNRRTVFRGGGGGRAGGSSLAERRADGRL